MRENGSEQENLYRKRIMVNAVEESIRTQMKDVQAEFLMCQFALLVVVPVKDENENMAKAVERWTMDLSVQLQKRFLLGAQPVQSGAESLHPAYRKVMQERGAGRGEGKRPLAGYLPEHADSAEPHMSELVYMEHYNSAFACFKEMADTLYQQKSRRLRNQQLSGLMSLTLCMLMETSSENNALLQEAGIDIGALTQPEDDEAELLAEWEKVFGLLEAHQDKRIRGQYSEQFASIYQYMHAHFRDSGLSLTALAEEFGMSVSTLSREFQKNLGQGFLDSLHQMRIEEAKYAIENTNASLNDIAISVGYTNTLTMTRAFKKYLGARPARSEKRKIFPDRSFENRFCQQSASAHGLSACVVFLCPQKLFAARNRLHVFQTAFFAAHSAENACRKMIRAGFNFFHATFFPFIFSFFLPLNPRCAPQNLSQNLHFGTMLTASFCARYTAIKQTASDETTDSRMIGRRTA